MHASSLCSCTHIVAIINELRSYLRFVIIVSWSVEILAMHTSSLCVCTHIVIVAIINELQSYFRFVIVVTKQDLKFE